MIDSFNFICADCGPCEGDVACMDNYNNSYCEKCAPGRFPLFPPKNWKDICLSPPVNNEHVAEGCERFIGIEKDIYGRPLLKIVGKTDDLIPCPLCGWMGKHDCKNIVQAPE